MRKTHFTSNIIRIGVSLFIVLVAALLLCGVAPLVEAVNSANEQTTADLVTLVPESVENQLVPTTLIYIKSNDVDKLQALINEMEDRQDNAHIMEESARALGYAEGHPVIELAQQEWWEAEHIKQQYINQLIQLEEAKQALRSQKSNEYPAAATIWYYFKDLGYNDYVCAGILGNLMAEVGGHTLDIQYWLSSRTYYGMCQWNRIYYPGVVNADLEGQCDFLRDTIKTELDIYGRCYKTGFKYNDFLALTDERSSALCFAKAYERCGSDSYATRQNNATTAYNYFAD